MAYSVLEIEIERGRDRDRSSIPNVSALRKAVRGQRRNTKDLVSIIVVIILAL